MDHLQSFIEYSLSRIDIEKIRKVFNINDVFETQLLGIQKIIEENINQIVSEFYNHILSDSEARSFFNSDEQIEKLININKVDIIQTFTPPIDLYYIKSRLRIGYVHNQIGLPPLLFVDGLYSVQNEIFSCVPSLEQQEIIRVIIDLERFIVLQATYNAYHFDLEEAELKYKDLLETVAHDVANPLQNLLFRIGQSAKVLEQLQSSAQQICSITDNVRGLLALKNKNENLELSPVNILEIMQKLYKLFVNQLSDKSIKLEIHYQEESSYFLWGNPVCLLHEVLSNIISNAIKFSEKGSLISISIDSDEEKVYLKITDQGPGFEKHQLKNLFSNKKESTLGTAGEKGTGFGLHLVYVYVKAMKGTISVTSKLKKEFRSAHGTTFILTFEKVLDN